MNSRATHPSDRFAPAAVARTLLFIAGPLLCLIRLVVWRDTYVITWPPLWAMVAAMVAGAALGGWLGWMPGFSGKHRPLRIFAVTSISALGWAMIGAYLLCWYVEVAAFANLSAQRSVIEAQVTGKNRSGTRGTRYWIDVRTAYSPEVAPLYVPQSLYGRVDADAGNQCLVVRIEAGRGGVVRARLDPPPELVTCGAALRAPS